MDDVRAGFRMTCGSWDHSASARPQRVEQGHRQRLSARGGAGNDRFREAAAKIYVTGSFWCGAASMAAAVATIGRCGKRGRSTWAHGPAAARWHRRAARRCPDPAKRPVQMPMVLFEDDPD